MMFKKALCLALAVLTLLSAGLSSAENTLLPYQSKGKKWTYVSFGSAPSKADGTREPIIWRVLSVAEDSVLLLSDRVLFAARVDGDEGSYTGWETSELYEALNSEFLSSAFSQAEQDALLSQEDGALVSLPSVEDLRNRAYGFVDDHARRAQGTDYARANGLQVYSGSRKDSPYWTKTPSPNHKNAQRRVMDEGVLGYLGVSREEIGVRPMILLSLADLLIPLGSGTEEDPYVLALPGNPEPQEAAPSERREEAPQTAPDTSAPSEQTASGLPDDETGAAESESLEDAASADDPADEDRAPVTGAPLSTPVSTIAVTEYASLFPALTEEGFLLAGAEEFVYADAEKGLWLYANPDLRIEIVRKTDTSKKNQPKRWFEADLFVRPGSGDFIRAYFNEQNPKTKKLAETADIARQNHLVFALNTDWYYYRVLRNAKKRTMTVGVVLRGGEAFYDDPAKKAANNIPNRDYIALFPDGRMEAYDYNGPGAEELKAQGAYDVFCFGPVLVRDGEVTEQALRIGARGNNNPRSAIGMVESGHYVAIMVEGRTKASVGCQLTYLADLFLKKGCTVAFNLDGGGTASMIFMGDYLNENTYSVQNRKQNEVLGIGISENVH